ARSLSACRHRRPEPLLGRIPCHPVGTGGDLPVLFLDEAVSLVDGQWLLCLASGHAGITTVLRLESHEVKVAFRLAEEGVADALASRERHIIALPCPGHESLQKMTQNQLSYCT